MIRTSHSSALENHSTRAAWIGITLRLIFFSIVASALIAQMAGAQRSLALTHARVVDVISGAISGEQTILVSSGRIVSMGIAGSSPSGAHTDTVNCEGKFVIPGLWDMHAHIGMTGRTSFQLYLANGVTGIRDMGSDRSVVHAWVDSARRRLIIAPRLFMAGSIVENARWLNSATTVVRRAGDTTILRDLSQRIPVSDVQRRFSQQPSIRRG